MIGGKVIQIDREAESTKLWVCDRNGDELCVHVAENPVIGLPNVGDEVWWQAGRVYFDGNKRELVKIGNSHAPDACSQRGGRPMTDIEQRDEWRDIETAPKDGTVVDLWVSDEDGDSVDFYTNGLGRFNQKTRRREGRVTDMRWAPCGPNPAGWRPVGGLMMMAMWLNVVAWMPLPEPPA